MREVFLNNFPEMSDLSKFSINFWQSSFPPAVSVPSEHTYLNVAFTTNTCLYLGFPIYVLQLI